MSIYNEPIDVWTELRVGDFNCIHRWAHGIGEGECYQIKSRHDPIPRSRAKIERACVICTRIESKVYYVSSML